MTVALSGNLEDLGLDDILQIIGASRRTGILTLSSRGREAVIHCRDGLLLRVSSTGFQQSLGQLMVQKGIIDAGVVSAALNIQQNEGFRERLGEILHKYYKVDLKLVEESVREQIINVLSTLFSWKVGTYKFQSRIDIDTVDGAYLDPLQFIMEMGSSLEDISSTDDFSEEFFEPSAALSDGNAKNETSPGKACLALVVVDDDPATAEGISAALKSELLDTHFETRSEDALIKIDALHHAGARPVIVIDMLMPKMDGSGVLGGLELLRLIRNNFPELKTIMISDFRHAEAEAEAGAMEAFCLSTLKPRRGDTGGEQFASFIGQLRTKLYSCLEVKN